MSNMSDTIYLDLETTGLTPTDEILEVGILSDSGEVILQTYVKPTKRTTWAAAQRINKIAPSDIENSPTLDAIRDQIIKAVEGKNVVIYNAAFDSQFLRNELTHAVSVKCCMIEFAPIYGEFNEYRGNFKWQRLEVAAKYIGFKMGGRFHSAIDDCRATQAVWQYCTNESIKKKTDKKLSLEAKQRELECVIKDFLDEIEAQELHEQREFIHKMNAYWNKLWGIRTQYTISGDEIYNLAAQRERKAEVYEAFTGYAQEVWDVIAHYEKKGLTSYQKRKDIPPNLAPLSRLKKNEIYPLWVFDDLSPVAFFLSGTGKTISLLYDGGDLKRIKASKPNRYESWNAVPVNLVSKTKLKREYRVNINKQNLKPVADVRMDTRNGIEYVPLYEIPFTLL